MRWHFYFAPRKSHAHVCFEVKAGGGENPASVSSTPLLASQTDLRGLTTKTSEASRLGKADGSGAVVGVGGGEGGRQKGKKVHCRYYATKTGRG